MNILRITANPDHPALAWSLDRLERKLRAFGFETQPVALEQWRAAQIVLLLRGALPAGLEADRRTLDEEGFAIRRADGRLVITGQDVSGLCYGMDELARQLELHPLDQVPEIACAPRFAFRAIKFNLPWSPYRSNQSVIIHRETVRDLAFWDAFLDMLAEHRFNVLTLWCVHPFPYMTRSASFPLATSLSEEELADWRAFWTGLFARSKERCIRPFLVNMNIFVSKGFVKHYDAKANDDSIHWGMAYTTPQIEQYLRESITQVIDEYPDLAGIGTSLGEHMDGISPEEREAFRDRVYHEAIRRVSRPVELIHRAPFSANTGAKLTRAAIENAELPELPHPVWVEIKYNFSHGYASPKLLAVHGVTSQSAGGAEQVSALLRDYWEPEPIRYKMALMVRNEDFFILRWAQPDFVRAHLAENDKSYVGGYFIGSEGFIPALEYAHKPGHPHLSWRYAFEKNRLYYMIWGRLLYDPNTPDSAFERDIDSRYGAGTGAPLFEAYRHACKMPMALATFCASTWDFSLYSEGFLSTRFNARLFTDWQFNGYAPDRSFITLERLMTANTLDPEWMNIRQYAEAFVSGRSTEGRFTPPQLADRLDADADKAEAALRRVPEGSPTLSCETDDIRAWIALSRYFADKLRAGVALAVYLNNHDPQQRAEAVRRLDCPHAKRHWQELVEITRTHYQEVPLVCLGTQPFSWALLLQDVEADLDYARGRHRDVRSTNGGSL